MKIKAAVIHQPGASFVFEDLELQAPREGQVLVRIVASGVCHTDEMGKNGMFPTPLPVVLGHEGSGIVEQVGPGVKSVAPGDHVVITFPACGVCDNCLAGRPNLCAKSAQLCFGGRFENGETPLSLEGEPVSNFFGQSSYATYALAYENGVVKVDPDVDLRLLGPLGCGIQTGAGAVINTFHPMPGDAIAVFGTGTVGMAAIMAAKACGCTTIVAVDVVQSRLERAVELGATHFVNSREAERLLDALMEITGGKGYDYSFDTTGITACYQAANRCLRWGGKGGGVAVSGEVVVDSWKDWFGGTSFTGIIEGDSMPQLLIPRLIRLYKAGLFPFDKLCEFFPFERIDEAFEASRSGRVFKPIVVME